jgi:hypothetical protein
MVLLAAGMAPLDFSNSMEAAGSLKFGVECAGNKGIWRPEIVVTADGDSTE